MTCAQCMECRRSRLQVRSALACASAHRAAAAAPVFICLASCCAGDCYIVSSGVLSSTDEGFAEVSLTHHSTGLLPMCTAVMSGNSVAACPRACCQVADEHDPEESTVRMFAMAQDMLAAAKEVCARIVRSTRLECCPSTSCITCLIRCSCPCARRC